MEENSNEQQQVDNDDVRLGDDDPFSSRDAESHSFSVSSAKENIAGIRNYFLTGLFVILPLAATVWVLLIIFKLIGGPLGNFLRVVSGSQISGGWEVAIGFLVTFYLITSVGFLAKNIVGRAFIKALDRFMLKLPFAKTIYLTSKQIIEAVTMQNRHAFRFVVLIEYPRRDMYAIGFVTSTSTKGLVSRGKELGKDMVSIFLPTTPNPTSGFLIMVPRRDVRKLDIPVEEAIKLIISGGVIAPNSEQAS